MTDRLRKLADNLSGFTSDSETSVEVESADECSDESLKTGKNQQGGDTEVDEDVDSMGQEQPTEMGMHDRAVKRANEVEDDMDKLDAKMALRQSYVVAKKLPSIRDASRKLKGVKGDLDELMWNGYTDEILSILSDADSKIGDFTIVQAAITKKSSGKK